MRRKTPKKLLIDIGGRPDQRLCELAWRKTGFDATTASRTRELPRFQ